MRHKGQKNLSYTQRLVLEAYLKAKLHKKVIAEKLGVCLATVYNEIKRGEYLHKEYVSCDYIGEKKYKTIKRYSPEKAQERYVINQSAKGAPLKIGNDFEFVRFIEKRVIKDKISPCATLGEIKRKKMFRTNISKTTLYRYIETDIFPNIRTEHLPFKHTKKRYRKIVAKRPIKGTSIEQRPAEILKRSSFGHWEMDCVVGKRDMRDILLVFTERLTRYEIILKMQNRKTETVVKTLNRLEKRFGKAFRKIFKSITVDNGKEFSDFHGIEKSIYTGNRVKVYYCHPYSSCERGSNERLNRDIRRWIPKGSDLSKYSNSQIQEVEDWVNAYPREIFGFASSSEMFQNQLKTL